MFSQFTDPAFWLRLVIRLPVILIALPVHEFAHGFVAHLCGDDTAKHNGRLTLNPMAHLDPIGTLCLIFAPIGWAKPVPVNPHNFRNPRSDDIKVSAAGPASNFLLAVISLILLKVIFQVFTHLPAWLPAMLFISVFLNIGLGLFNLLPLFPLDGSHIVQNMLKWPASEKFAAFSRYAPLLLLAFVVMGGGRLLFLLVNFLAGNFISILMSDSEIHIIYIALRNFGY